MQLTNTSKDIVFGEPTNSSVDKQVLLYGIHVPIELAKESRV